MIGKFRQQIYLYEIEQGQPDGLGGYVTSKSEKQLEWCEVKQMKGKRAFDYMKIYNSQPFIFNIRYNSYNVSYKTILEYEDKIFIIHSITSDPLKKFTEIIAWE